MTGVQTCALPISRAVGTSQEYALIPIDLAHVLWAEEIVVMGRDQKTYITDLLVDYDVDPDARPIHVLDVPDNYGFRDEELVEILTETLKNIFKP